MNRTIEYYNQNARSFYDRTINSDQAQSYKAFLKYLPNHAHILDAGCGSGRDSRYFLDQGYQVSAFDASTAMIELASRLTGLEITHQTFQEMKGEAIFDGIWAQASLLHVPYEETPDVYSKINHALKPGGIFFGSYKYGYEPMPTETRDFWLMDEERLKGYLEEQFEIIEIWTQESVTNVDPSPFKKWLCFVARKI